MSTRRALAAQGVAPIEGVKDPRSPWTGLLGNGTPVAPPVAPPAAPPAAPLAQAKAAAPPLEVPTTKAEVEKQLAKVGVDELVMTKDGNLSVVVEVEPMITAYQVAKSWTSDKDTKVRAAPALRALRPALRPALRLAPPRPVISPAQVYAWGNAKPVSFDAVPLKIAEKLASDSKLITKRMRDSLKDVVYISMAKRIKAGDHTKYLVKQTEEAKKKARLG